jgi:predicted transcriptional regulator
MSLAQGSFFERLMAVNIYLVLFNLIPAFPMDGGRVLRALLALKLDYVQATQIAATIGQGIALLFGFIGLFTNSFLLFIALFVWIGAAQEASMVQVRHSLGGIPITRAMQTDFQVLSPSDTLARVVELILAGSQQDFPVVENGRVAGILDRDTFISALSKNGQNTSAAEVMHRNVPEIDSHDMVEKALTRLQESGSKTLPVTHGGRLVGLITAENITEFLMIRSALKTAGGVTGI